MRIVSADRRQGRTTALLRWWLEEPAERVIIFAAGEESRRDAIAVMQSSGPFANNAASAAIGRFAGNLTTPDRCRHATGRSLLVSHKQVAVDDFEFALQQLFGCVPDIVTTTICPVLEFELENL